MSDLLRIAIRTLSEGVKSGRRVKWKSAYHATEERKAVNWPKEGVPLFITSDLECAKSYLHYAGDEGDGVILELDAWCRNAANYNQYLSVLEYFEIPELKPPQFPWDAVYSSRVRNELENRGFDGLIGREPEVDTGRDIPVMIVWHRHQVRVIGAHKLEGDVIGQSIFTGNDGVEREYDPESGKWIVTRLPQGWE